MKFKHNDKVRLLVERICGNGQEGVIREDSPPGRNSPEEPWVKFPDGWSFLRDYGEENFELIKEDTMKERVLKADEVIREGQKFHFKDGDILSSDIYTYLYGHTVGFAKRQNWSSPLTKVTRPEGEKMKEKIKQYPKNKKVYVQFNCPDNDDDFMMKASFNPKELNESYPFAECTIGDLKEIVVTKSVKKVRQ